MNKILDYIKTINLYNLFARLIVVFIGFIVISMGVSLLLCCKIGSDPVSVFNDGLSSFLHTKFGIAQIITNSIMLILVLLLKKKHYINIATIFSAIALGPIIDFAISIASRFVNDGFPLWSKVIICSIATILLSLGVALYISPCLGIGPTDVMSEITSEMLHIQYKYVRVTIDCTFVACGYLLGGIVGIGTIIAAVGTGPLVQLFRPFANKFSNTIVKLIDKKVVEE